MILPDGYHDVPAGKLAAIVTYLEMGSRPDVRPDPTPAPWSLRRVEHADASWYRALFVRIGEPWLWASRLALGDAGIRAVLADPLVELYVLGDDEGILELDFRVAGQCELVYFGLVADRVGTGAGRWLMNRALELAWSRPIERFWLHTCSLDHPQAPAFYLRSGFRAYRRGVEIFDDPRVTGALPPGAAPGVLRL